jgi:hypothetical protein
VELRYIPVIQTRQYLPFEPKLSAESFRGQNRSELI